MGTERVERRLAAILAADVAGYSRLTSMDGVPLVRAFIYPSHAYAAASSSRKGSSPLTILATDRSVSLSPDTVPALLMSLKIGPASMPAASSHARRARAGHATSPRAMAMVTPASKGAARAYRRSAKARRMHLRVTLLPHDP